MQYTIPKGVFDILPNEPQPENYWRSSDHWQYVEEIVRKTAHDYGYKEMRTPLFERTELFVRGVGESSDIVTKEMYTFEDKAGRSMTLRPEATASTMRAFVENQLYQQSTVNKYFYLGPMFRYERPQAGRYRQHHQFGAEAIGIAKPEQDVETIDLLCEIYRRLGIRDLTVMINSVGDSSCRQPYMQALSDYLRPHLAELSADSQARFGKNVLRILDSKDAKDQKLLEGAPSILKMLNEECREHFDRVQKLLDETGVAYEVNQKLVRGLDYYSKTVFEVVCGQLGAQNTIGGGGRYDSLIADLGGPNLPAVGFATGLERVLQTMVKQNISFPPPPHPFIFLIPLGDASTDYCFQLLCKLRHEKISADMDLSGKKVQHGLQLANSLGAEYCSVIGDQELSSGEIKLKNMAARTAQDVRLDQLVSTLKELYV